MPTITADTNILVSALIAKGKPRKLIKKVEQQEVNLVLSNSLIEELSGVVKRDKFRKYVTLSNAENFVVEVRELSKIIDTKSQFEVIKQDPDDNKILNAAYDGKADYIVSGDSDLLNLKEFEGIKIVTVSKMLEILERK